MLNVPDTSSIDISPFRPPRQKKDTNFIHQTNITLIAKNFAFYLIGGSSKISDPIHSLVSRFKFFYASEQN